MTIKVLFSVSTRYVGSTVKEEVFVEIDDDATEEEIDAEINEWYDNWLDQNIDICWDIIGKTE